MQVERIHQIDASAPDASGRYEYYYEYDLYRFTDGPVCFVARSYADEPDKAHFLRAEINGKQRPMKHADLQHPLLLAALSYLRGAGKMHIHLP